MQGCLASSHGNIPLFRALYFKENKASLALCCLGWVENRWNFSISGSMSRIPALPPLCRSLFSCWYLMEWFGESFPDEMGRREGSEGINEAKFIQREHPQGQELWDWGVAVTEIQKRADIWDLNDTREF